MKIKEVIEQTGLTDRAIRLYISNGLIAPATQHSYTGRNSYDFTEEDVAILQQIALLRKAEFSLEQIKILQQGGEGARTVFLQYLQDKQASVIQGQKILSALGPHTTNLPFFLGKKPPSFLSITIASRETSWET